MPLVFYKKIDIHTSLGVWEISESESWFRDRLFLVQEEITALEKIQSPAKRKEWLAARWLLHYLGSSEKREPCLKDAFGKPYLLGRDTEISISHSGGRAAVLRSAYPCGIDIQKQVGKIRRIEKKFVNANEQKWIRPDHYAADLHLIWGAKESLYKTYSKKKVDFCKELEIRLPNFDQKIAEGIITKNKKTIYDIHFQWMDEYLLVYSLPQPQ